MSLSDVRMLVVLCWIYVGFRDENEALRQRIRNLESESEQLRDENAELERRLAGEEDAAEEELVALSEIDATPTSLAAHVRERKAGELAEQRKAQQKRNRAIARLSDRAKRVLVTANEHRKVIRFERSAMRDRLRAQFPWGFGFAFVNPGIFIMLGIAVFLSQGIGVPDRWALPATLLTWMTILFLINAAYARLTNPKWRLEVTNEHFALFKGGRKKPKLFGALSELKVRAPEPNPAKLHTVEISDGRSETEVEYLTADDVIALQKALGNRGD